MCLCGLRLKTQKNFLHTVHYCFSFWNVDFYKAHRSESEACSDWPAIQCVVIGRIPQAWDGNVTPLTYCDAVSWHDDTKTIKPIVNKAFVASVGHNYWLYCLFTHCAAQTLPCLHLWICEHYSTQLKTSVWIVSSRNVLTGCESEVSDCPYKVVIAPLHRNSLWAQLAGYCYSPRFREQSSVKCTLIFGLSCSGTVVNTT